MVSGVRVKRRDRLQFIDVTRATGIPCGLEFSNNVSVEMDEKTAIEMALTVLEQCPLKFILPTQAERLSKLTEAASKE